MERDKFRRIVIRVVTGEASEAEIRMLQELLKSPGHRAFYESVVSAWTHVPEPPSPPSMPDKKKQWADLEKRLSFSSEKKPVRVPDTGWFFRWVAGRPGIAAAGAAIACLLAAAVILHQPVRDLVVYRSVRTQNGETKTWVLPDGSQVLLNHGSRLSVPRSFTPACREVKLQGEAFFDVMAAEGPFTIQTGNATVTVLGTEFDVWAREKKKRVMETRVIVKEGTVRLGASGSDTADVKLTAGLMASVDRRLPPSVPVPVDVNHRLGWMERRLVFEETPVREAFQELVRYYNVSIVLKDKELESLTITAVFDRLGIDVVLESICLAIDAEYVYEKGHYTVFSRN